MELVQGVQGTVSATALAQARWSQQNWTAHAVCTGMTELFFPPAGEREPARIVREAKARQVCASCPVIAECRDYARRNHEYGFWGGENEEARFSALRRLRRAAAAG